MNIDFSFLEKSVGKTLKFEVNYQDSFVDIFYAKLSEVFDDYIIVEQFTIESDENFENEKAKIIRRKLIKNKFTISNEIPLNG
jgi:hypothetical protein